MGSCYHEPPPVDEAGEVLATSFKLFAKVDEGAEPGKLFANLDDVSGVESKSAGGQPAEGSIDSKSDWACSPIESQPQESGEGLTEAEWAAALKFSCDSIPRGKYKNGLPMFHREEMAQLGEAIHSGRIQYWFVNHLSLFIPIVSN